MTNAAYLQSITCGPDSLNKSKYTLHAMPDEKGRYEIRTEIPHFGDTHIVDVITAKNEADAKKQFTDWAKEENLGGVLMRLQGFQTQRKFDGEIPLDDADMLE